MMQIDADRSTYRQMKESAPVSCFYVSESKSSETRCGKGANIGENLEEYVKKKMYHKN